MRPFYLFVHRHFALLFWPVFIGAFILAFIQLNDKPLLTNQVSPRGIVSLELAWTPARDSAIVYAWKADVYNNNAPPLCQGDSIPRIDRLATARTDIHVDYLFIIFYTALALIIIAGLQTRTGKEASGFSNLLLLLALVAGICDYIENGGMIRALEVGMQGGKDFSHTGVFIASLASLIKFIILGFLTLLYLPFTLIVRDDGLMILSNYIREKSIQLFRYRVILLGLLIFSVPIWIMNQGQDLVINSNASNAGVILFITVIVLAATLNWYLSKLFFQTTYRPPIYPLKEPHLQDKVQEAAEKKVSRFLGIATIIAPATAVLNAMAVIRVPSILDFLPPVIWLIGLLGAFFALIKTDAAGKYYRSLVARGKRGVRTWTIIIIVLLAFILPLLLLHLGFRGAKDRPESLFFLFFHLVLVATAFYIFVSTRNDMFPGDSWLGDSFGWPVIIAGGILSFGFILLNFFPGAFVHWDLAFLSLPVLQSGIVFYILAFTLLIRAGLALKINIVLFLFLIGLVISIAAVNDFHAVDQHPVQSPPQEITMEEYFRQWLLARKDEVSDSDTAYPVFLVNTYGGGVKAAAFTGMLLTSLDAWTMQHDSLGHSFEHYTFSLSGASGGTIGAAVQCAFRSKYPDKDSNGVSNLNHYNLDAVEQFYKHDFLTPVLCNLLGRDILASSTSMPLWPDRSGTQEETWARFAEQDGIPRLDSEFNSIWDTSTHNHSRYEVPLLFSNTLNVDDGLKGIMAPVRLSHFDFPATIFIRERVDALNKQHKPGKDSVQSLSLITGAFLSARFPFISPSGKMGPGYHFMDGGGKDNSGASTSQDIFLRLAVYVDSLRHSPTDTADKAFHRILDRVRFYFVSISNSPFYDPASDRHLVSNRFEPVSPLVGIINSGINGNARAADSILHYRYTSHSVARLPGISAGYSSVWITATCIRDTIDGKAYSPVLPLGWQISYPSLQRLRASFSEEMINSYNPIGISTIRGILKPRLKKAS